MSHPVEVLDRIARSDDAVFAFDANDLIILWNRATEKLLGRPAYQVLGRHCYDVMCGRDVYGNRYCCETCPVSTQARVHPDEAIHRFLLDVPVAGGAVRRLSVTMFAIPASRPSLSTLVHVLRDPEQAPSSLEHELEAAVTDRAEPRQPPRTEGEITRLTPREQEILRRMAQGLTTSRISQELFISPVTVRNHIAKILSKLDVHTKLAAVAFAYRHGLVGPESPLLPSAATHGAARATATEAARSAKPSRSRRAN
jgi:DNA-binding CsgD family transcriptional regulator